MFFVTAIGKFGAPRQLIFQQKRFRGKINIQKPQKLFYERALVTEFVTPYYPAVVPPRPIWEACHRAKKQITENPEPHPYQRILAREIFERFEASKMTAFLHKNSITSEDTFELSVKLHKCGMSLKLYGRSLVANATKGTRYEAVLPLYCAPTFVVFSPEPNVTALEKAVKKTHQVALIAGILEDHLLSVNDFLKYGKMNITGARSGLVHMLRTAGGMNLNRQLNHHQSTLVTRLQQISEGRETENEKQEVNADASKSEEVKTV